MIKSKLRFTEYQEMYTCDRVGSFFRGAVSSTEKSGFFRPGRNMFLPFLPMLLEETYLFQFSLNF